MTNQVIVSLFRHSYVCKDFKEKGISIGNKIKLIWLMDSKWSTYVTVFALQIVLTFCPLLLHSAKVA